LYLEKQTEQTRKLQRPNKFFETMANSKYSEVTLTNKNEIYSACGGVDVEVQFHSFLKSALEEGALNFIH
jgi:hypothetical protein